MTSARYVFVLLVCSAHLFASAHAESVTIRVTWQGGTATCNKSSCTGDETYVNSTFACDNPSNGNWSNGQIVFEDPLPSASYLVTQVQLRVAGRFNCLSQSSGTVLIYTLQNSMIAMKTMEAKPTGCECPRCVSFVNVTSDEMPQGWGGYAYGGNNTLIVSQPSTTNLTNGVCIAFIDITLIYEPASPYIFAATPPGGPIAGGTNVAVWGDLFSSAVQYNCLFGDENGVGVPAQYVNENTLNCITPVATVNKTHSVNFLLKVVANGQVVLPASPISYLYYNEPTVTALIPSEAECTSNLTILVKGSGFLKLQSLRCLWDGMTNFATVYINSTHIQCPISSALSPGVVNVQVSENGQQSTSALPFLCKAPPANKGHTIPGWVWIVLVFGGSTTLVVTILFASRKCNSSKDSENPDDLETSRLLGTEIIKQIRMQDIKLLNKIGKGTFGEVFKGTWNGTEIAVKFLTSPNVNHDDQFLQDFYKEVTIMKSLRHPNVLQFLGAVTEPANICIVMEYMTMGSLFKILHDETVVLHLGLLRRMLIDAARGMNYLHKSNPLIIHRDLKSHNLLVDENYKVKVCDFGLSKILEKASDFTTMTACGTPSWTAPEILRNESYTESADVYSFGIVLWECLTREDPYYGMPPFQVVLAVGTKGMRPPVPETAHAGWKQLMTDCWAEDPSQRPNMDQILERLEAMVIN